MIREVSLVLPDTVWLTNLTGTVAPEVTVTGAASASTRSSIPGPALAMIGCARSQQDVAELINAVGDIDGVTRVLVENSEKPTGAATGAGRRRGPDQRGLQDEGLHRQVPARRRLRLGHDRRLGAPRRTPAAPEGRPAAEATPTSADTSAQTQQAEQQQNVEAATDRGRKAAGLIGAGDGG